MKKEAALLEATEQKFGAKLDYAKTLGNWARGIQKKFIDGLILHRQEDPHTKIHRVKVVNSEFDGRGVVAGFAVFCGAVYLRQAMSNRFSTFLYLVKYEEIAQD